MRALAQHSPDKLADLLAERLAFERASVALYDAIIAELEASNDARAQRALPTLREYRDEEHDHAGWLGVQIRALGAADDDFADARSLALDTFGIEQIVLDGDTDPAHLFHALLVAELADAAGWQLLVTLADDAGDRDAKREFKVRMREAERHLSFVRRAVEQLARSEVLGDELRLPASP